MMLLNVTLLKVFGKSGYRVPLGDEVRKGNRAFAFVQESGQMILKPNPDLPTVEQKYKKRGHPVYAVLEVDAGNSWTIVNVSGVQVYVKGDLLQEGSRTHLVLASPATKKSLIETGDKVKVNDLEFKLVDGDVPNY